MSQFFVNISDGNLPPDVPIKFTADDGNFATPSGNNLNVFGDDAVISTFIPTPGGDTLRIRYLFPWSEKNANFNADAQNGYYCNAALTVNLPATADVAIGSTVIIYVDTMQHVTIQANANQRIQVGQVISGEAGTTTSNTQGALLELNFKPSDLTWHTISSMGSWMTV